MMVLGQLVTVGRQLSANRLSDELLERAKHCVLDWIGVAIAGGNESVSRRIAKYVRSQEGSRQASIIGSLDQTTTTLAAFANAAFGHALDFDDVHFSMFGHPSATVIPAALAVAEAQHKTGRDLLTAIVAGIETECLLGQMMTESHYHAGWHSTATLGIFGATTAASLLLDLSDSECEHALSLASSRSAGLQVQFGAEGKAYQVGKASADGIEVALLAGEGLTGNNNAIDGLKGFRKVYSGKDSTSTQYEVGGLFVGSILFKYHASCFGTQAAAEATRKLCFEHPDIVSNLGQLKITIPSQFIDICNVVDPQTPTEAKFSVRFVCALILAGRRTDTIEAYDTSAIADPRVRHFMDRIIVLSDDTLPNAAASICAFRSEPNPVPECYVTADLSVAEPDTQYQFKRLDKKFRVLTAPLLGQTTARKLVNEIMSIERCEDVSSVLGLLQTKLGWRPVR